jgi:hypothetical protein
MTPCEIVVALTSYTLLDLAKNRLGFVANCTSLIAAPRRIRSFDPLTLRFSDDCQLKTTDSQRNCTLRFPYGTGRSHSNGLLEQMP